MPAKHSLDLPHRSEKIYQGFVWYCRRLVRKRFQCFALDTSALQDVELTDRSVIIYANHPSWWDPILAVLAHEALFLPRKFFAPIDAIALEKYQVFKKLGFFGVDQNTMRGSAEFIRASNAILFAANSVLWLTPEGRFTDARDGSPPLMPGLSHLMSKSKKIVSIPLAIEYPFLNEQKPYMLAKLGKPVDNSKLGFSDKTDLLEHLSDQLRHTQQQLATTVMGRDISQLTPIVSPRVRPNGLYDWARVLKSIVTRQPIQLEHDRR